MYYLIEKKLKIINFFQINNNQKTLSICFPTLFESMNLKKTSVKKKFS